MIRNANLTRIPKLFLFLLLGLLLSSCTPIDPMLSDWDFKKNWDSLINKMSYDDALMTWGEPASRFEGDEIFVVTWGNRKGGGAVFPIGKAWFAMPIESGWKLQLSFSKTTRKMLSWKYELW